MKIELNDRIETIRTILAELNRIQSHLLWWGVFGMDLGAFTPFLYGFREIIVFSMDEIRSMVQIALCLIFCSNAIARSQQIMRIKCSGDCFLMQKSDDVFHEDALIATFDR